jgi:hypothetical protein
MASLRLNPDEIELLDGIEPGRKLKTISKSKSFIENLSVACERKTYEILNYVKQDGEPFYQREVELASPCVLPCKNFSGLLKTEITMIGGEKLTFQRFMSTVRGDIFLVFTEREFDGEIYVKIEDLTKVFGRGNRVITRLGGSELIKTRNRLKENDIAVERAKANSEEEIQKETGENPEGYGTW